MTEGPRSARPLVELIGISRHHRLGGSAPPVKAIDDVTLRIDPGEYLAIVGRSGSGKTTLLHLVGLIDQPTAGRYRFDGIDVTSLSERQQAALRGRSIGLVFQAFHLLADRSVVDNAALGLAYLGIPRAQRRRRALDALEHVGLAPRAEFIPRQLSGGEQQRVAIARAVATGPRLLLCDEPTGNLDASSREVVLDVLERVRATGCALVIVTHDREISGRAQRRVTLADGRILTDTGPPGPGNAT